MFNTITYHTIISGEWVEVIKERHRQDKLIHEIHASEVDSKTMSASNSSDHIGHQQDYPGQSVLNSTGLTSVGKSKILLTLVYECQMKKGTTIQKYRKQQH